MAYLVPKPSLQENSTDPIQPIDVWIRIFNSFSKSISPEINGVVWLEFELAYYQATFKHFSH